MTQALPHFLYPYISGNNSILTNSNENLIPV